jgi:leucine dehydrogenase
MPQQFEHEQVIIRTGARSGLPIIVAIHSTVLGQALGGLRLKHYADWRDGLTDALRLSLAMSDKCAAAGLPNGGGKTVVAVPAGRPLTAALRRAALLDVGDAVAELDGRYGIGPDVGTGPPDMDTVAERTEHAFCRPVEHGGSGDSSVNTAQGVLAAVRAVAEHRFGSPDLAGRRFAILGLGHVGGDLATRLAGEGAKLVVADVDDGRKALADRLGAAWVGPDEAFRADVDILVPAALGGLFTAATIGDLRCAAICGPANNQLDEPAMRQVADRLHERGIVWAPDFVVSAGGVIYAAAVEIRHEPPATASALVDGIGATIAAILATGEEPLTAALRLAHARRRADQVPGQVE